MNVVMEMFATILDVQVQGLPVDLSICGVCCMRLAREAIHHCLIISQLPRPIHHSLLLHKVHIPPAAAWLLYCYIVSQLMLQVVFELICTMALRCLLSTVTIVSTV